MSKDYLLPETLSFEDEDGIISSNKIWGCQLSADVQEIKILAGDCTMDPDSPEFCMLIQLKNAPAYGLYLSFKESYENPTDGICMIEYSLDYKGWLECNTFLQSTFLAGMEQLKEIGFAWNKASNYQPQYQSLLSFIKFHSTIYEAEHEGQES